MRDIKTFRQAELASAFMLVLIVGGIVCGGLALAAFFVHALVAALTLGAA